MSKAVMTIHGFLTDTEDFGILYDCLTPLYDEVYKVKIPGHNDPVDFKLFNKTDTINTVLNAFDYLKSRHDTVDVVGFSMGGALATMLSALRDVNKVVLMAPSNMYINMMSFYRTAKFYFAKYNDTYNKVEGDRKTRSAAANKEVDKYRQNAKNAMAIALKRIIPNLSFHTYGVFRSLMMFANETLDNAAPVTVPALLLYGELDELVPALSMDYVKARFSDIKVKVYPDIGHAMMVTNRKRFLCKTITNFLAK
jgi:esterase/lipase